MSTVTTTQTGKIALDVSLRNTLLSCLNDIEKADPMQYRREAVDRVSNAPHATITVEDLREIARLQDVLTEPGFSSHRPVLGPFIRIYKKFVFRFVRKWLHVSLGKQFELNQRLLNLALSVHVLENKVHSLEKSIQDRK